jgi:hypothetical protein
MTEQELRDLVANDLVRIVTTDREFFLITTHPSLCTYDTERAVATGHVRCWCLETARWLSIDARNIFAYQALNHSMSAVALD